MRFEASLRGLEDATDPVPSDLVGAATLLTSYTLDDSCSEFPLPSMMILVAFSTFTMCSHIALVFLKRE